MPPPTRRRLLHAGLFFLVSSFVLCPLYFLGCAHPKPRNDLSFSTFHNHEFQWRRVGRVLVLPVVNESAVPEATEQFRRSLDAELQQLGLFEVVPTPPEVAARLSKCVRETGRFDEGEIVDLARCTSADVLVVVTLSQYSPYVRPRIGLTVQAISPDLGKIVAAVDGLWDTNNLDIADRARRFYARKKTHAEHAADHVLQPFDDAYGSDLAIESPHLFQRFVAGEVVRLLVGDPNFLAVLRPAVPKPYEAKPTFAISLPQLLHGLLGKCDASGTKTPTRAAQVPPAANNSARNKP